jgi:hypothetical protein
VRIAAKGGTHGITGFLGKAAYKTKTMLAAPGIIYSIFSTILLPLSALVLFILVKVILPFAQETLRGIQSATSKLKHQVQAKQSDSWRKKVVHIAFRFFPETTGRILKYLVLPVFANIVTIVCTILLAFFFIYFVERHLSQTISVISDTADIGVSAINLFGRIGDSMLEVHAVTLPITNMMTRFNVKVVLTIYDGLIGVIDAVQAQFGNGRRLSELGMETFFEDLKPLILLGQYIYNVYLYITTTIIDLFFATHLINVILLLSDIIVIIATKLTCTLAGQYCIILETLDFLVYDVIVAFINLILGIFGIGIPITHDIACATVVLSNLGVPKECLGCLFCSEPPGPFRNAPKNQRRLISCIEHSGAYHEFLGEELVHSTPKEEQQVAQQDACPHVRQSFHPRGNSLNMQKLDTHECYDMCVRNVLVESCHGTQKKFMGTCGKRTTNFTHEEARRRLDAFFSFDTDLHLHSPMENTTPNLDFMTRSNMVSHLRDLVGSLQFTTDNGECDLRSPPNDIFEILYDGMCAMKRLSSATPSVNHRNLFQQDHRAVNGTRWPMFDLGPLHHHNRILATYSASHTLTHTSSPVLHLRSYLETYKHTPKCVGKIPCPHHGKCVQNVSDCNPIIKTTLKPKGHSNRRKLLEECIGQILCPNEYQCVDTIEECIVDQPISIMGNIRYYLEIGHDRFTNFDIGDAFYDVMQCWRKYETNPETDPYNSANLQLSLDELAIKCVWCLPMWEPFVYTYEPIVYSFREEVYKSCIAISEHFNACRCPMFYELQSVTLPFYDFVSTDTMDILFNGVIWFKYVFYVISLGYPAYWWSSVFPDSFQSREFSGALSLYSEKINTETYIICEVAHTGSALALVIVCVVIFQLCLFTYSMALFFTTGGMIQSEREEEELRKKFRLDELEKNVATLMASKMAPKKTE